MLVSYCRACNILMSHFFTYIFLCGFVKQLTCTDRILQENFPFPLESLSSSLPELSPLLRDDSNVSSLPTLLSPPALPVRLPPAEFPGKPVEFITSLSVPSSPLTSAFVLPHIQNNPQNSSPSSPSSPLSSSFVLPHSQNNPQPSPQSSPSRKSPHFQSFGLAPPSGLLKHQQRSQVHTQTLRNVDPPWDPNVPQVVDPPKEMEADKYLCSLLKMDVPLCSCVIVSKTFALTACDYCMRDTNTTYIPEDFTVMYGVSNKQSLDKNMEAISHRVQRLIRHPRCYSLRNVYTPNFDIGIVQVFEEVQLAPRYYARLPRNVKDSWNDKEYLHLSNLRTYDVFPAPPKDSVWHVLTKQIDKSFCDLLETKEVGLNNTCISYHHMGGRSACQVDIGTALTVRNNRTADKLIGLLINKAGCGRPSSFGSCVLISTSLQWVRWQVSLYSDGRELV